MNSAEEKVAEESSPASKRREPVMATVDEAIEDFRAGKFVVIVDDEGRENEGDLVIAAEGTQLK